MDRKISENSRKNDFQPITSSPEFPRSNGLAEKGVQIVKRILKKNDSHGDFWLGLLAYRSSPLEDGRSPGELLQGRHLRTTVPKYQDDPGTTVESIASLRSERHYHRSKVELQCAFIMETGHAQRQ